MTETQIISVVIPVFDREDLIEETLNSVFSQTYRPLEIVVVDDGSTDQTEGVVHDWASKYESASLIVRCIEQKNRGANAARNRGIAESSGRVIAFLDSDDHWLPDKLCKQLIMLESDERFGGVYCGLQTLELESGNIHPSTKREYLTGNILAKMLIRDVSNPTSCWMVRKQCFDEVGKFDTSLPARQDWDMWIRLATKYHVGCVPEVLVEMGEHSGERVRSDPSREIAAAKTIFSKYSKLRKDFPLRLSLAARSAMYRRHGRVLLHRKGARLKAAGMQVLAIMVWPFEFDSYAALLGTLLPQKLRSHIHVLWNAVFGKTRLSIRSH